MNRRKALKTIGKIVLGSAMAASLIADSSIVSTALLGCRQETEQRQIKEGILEKKLTEFGVVSAHFGPDDKVYYHTIIAKNNIFTPLIHFLSLKEPTVKRCRDEETLFGFSTKYADAKVFVDLNNYGGGMIPGGTIPGHFAVCASEYGVAAISFLHYGYGGILAKKGISEGIPVSVFTPDGKLVSSENIEDRLVEYGIIGIFYGDEKGFYAHRWFIPIDGSKPVRWEGDPPGWEQWLKKRHETGKILLPKEFELSHGPGGIDHYIRDIRDTEKGREVLYSKDTEKGLYYAIISKDKLGEEK